MELMVKLGRGCDTLISVAWGSTCGWVCGRACSVAIYGITSPTTIQPVVVKFVMVLRIV